MMGSFDGNLTRFQLDGVFEERGGQLFMDGRGVGSERFKRLYVNQAHGFASVPIEGAQAVLLNQRANRESGYLFGGEHAGHRPVLPQGGAALYDQWGGILKWIEDGVVLDTKSRTARFTMSGWTVEAPEGITFKGDLHVDGNITASGSIVDTGGNTNHHSH